MGELAAHLTSYTPPSATVPVQLVSAITAQSDSFTGDQFVAVMVPGQSSKINFGC